jgi:HlyD family secretion protein
MNCVRIIQMVICPLLLVSCGSNTPKESDEQLKVSTPVTVTSVGNSDLSEMISFNGVSAFQRKNIVKANINGYIDKSFVNQGDIVKIGQPLYVVKTKEEDAVNQLASADSSLSFNRKHTILSPTSGVIVEATRQTNDYIVDGEQLCVLAAQSSFVFVLNVPFEQNKFAATGKKCSIHLPDSTVINGMISGKLSTVDPVSQTQSFIVKPLNAGVWPENLSVSVQIVKVSKVNAMVIDKLSVLSDETLENFWVMRLINDTTAVKTIIKPGIIDGNRVEILSPLFSHQDRIISKGSYGLPDTAFVKIIQH